MSGILGEVGELSTGAAGHGCDKCDARQGARVPIEPHHILHAANSWPVATRSVIRRPLVSVGTHRRRVSRAGPLVAPLIADSVACPAIHGRGETGGQSITQKVELEELIAVMPSRSLARGAA